MDSPEIMQLVQKGILQKAAVCLFSPERLGWDLARHVARARLLAFASYTALLRWIF